MNLGPYKDFITDVLAEVIDDILTDLYATSPVARMIMQSIHDRKLQRENESSQRTD